MSQKEISSRVKKLLEKMQPVDLASKMGVSMSTVYRLRKGVKRPHRLILEALEKAEGKSIVKVR